AYNGINAYLANLSQSETRSVEGIVAYNKENAGTEGPEAGDTPAFPSGQDSLREVQECKGVEDETYHAALKHIQHQCCERGIDAALMHKPADGQAIEFDALLLCDRKGGGQQIAAQAGYPIVTIPIGLGENGFPVGLSLQHTAWQEARLVKWASAIEDLVRHEWGGRATPGDEEITVDMLPVIDVFGQREHAMLIITKPLTMDGNQSIYKAFEAAVLSWLAFTSNQYGWRKPETHLNAKTSVQEARLQEKLGSVLPSTSRKRPAKYFLSIEEIVSRTDLIVKHGKTKPRVPQYVIHYLRESIALRSRCSEWFSKHMAGIRSVEESTKTHLQFKQIMEEVLLKLEPCMVPAKTPSSSGKTNRASGELFRETATTLKFTKLDVEDPKDQPEDEFPAKSLVDSPEGLPDSSQLDEVYEVEPTIEDKLMEMSSVLDTLQELREHVQAVWTQYQKRETSLVVATITTNTAIDLARMKEDGFAAQFPDIEAWERLTTELFPSEAELWTRNLGAITPGDLGKMDRLFQLPTKALAAIRDHHETHGYPTMLLNMLPQINRVYDPCQHVSNLTPPARLNQDKILLESLFPEFVIQKYENVHVTHDLITTAFETMLQSKTVRLWMSFSFQLVCDIHHALGDEHMRPYKDFKEQA
ncbi:MAG: hypothetical protein Q9174_006602, partial [Haloplaca sp. 1 TL-2023]